VPLIPLRDQLPTRKVPFVNYMIIAANVAVFFFERQAIASGITPQRILLNYGLIPARVWIDPGGALQTLFTSMFMHDPTGLMHIAGNMLFLWIFGDNVEEAMGHGRYLLFYFLGGTAAAVAQVAAGPTSIVPMVGASGAIAAVLAGYAFLYPHSPITILNLLFIPLWFFTGPFVKSPAWLVILVWFALNLYSALRMDSSGGVAVMAHVGGFVAGVALLRPFMAGRVRMDDYARWQRWVERRREADRDGY